MPDAPHVTPKSLRLARKQRRLGQAELAGIVGIDRAYLCRVELGERTPSPEVAARIAQAFEVPADHFTYPQGDAKTAAALDRLAATWPRLDDQQKANLAILLDDARAEAS